MIHSLSSRVVAITILCSLFCFGVAQNDTDNPNSVCYSYGVDFVDEGHYFINTGSNDTFTCVSTFEGCNQDEAEVLLVNPAGDETFCSQIPTLPDDTAQLSNCPVVKSQMTSGHYMILILGNNGNGQPYAWQRDLYLDCGKQITTTVTPTVTFNITFTPIVVLTSTSTLRITSKVGPNTTYTIPSATGSKTHTITPPAVDTTLTSTITHKNYTWTRELSLTTQTVTASRTTLSSVKQDKPCTYSPTMIHPAALVTPTSSTNPLRFTRKSDCAVDISYARARMAAARRRRDAKAGEATLPVPKVGYDAATITHTVSPPLNTTIVYTAASSTISHLTVVTSITATTLPPTTTRSGIHPNEVTLPTPTRTKVVVTYTTNVETKTFKATFTRITTVTPKVSCGVGGYFPSAPPPSYGPSSLPEPDDSLYPALPPPEYSSSPHPTLNPNSNPWNYNDDDDDDDDDEDDDDNDYSPSKNPWSNYNNNQNNNDDNYNHKKTHYRNA